MKGADDDVVGKRPKVGISMAWWKEAWPAETPPKSYNEVRSAITLYKRTKSGRSVGDFADAVEDLVETLEKVAEEARKQLKRHPLKKRAFLKDIEKAKAMAEDERDKALKAGNSETQFYKASFSDILQKQLVKANITWAKIPEKFVELSLPAILVDELIATNSSAMLISQLDAAVKAHARKATAEIAKASEAHGHVNKILKRDATDALDSAFAALTIEVGKLPQKVISKTINNKEIARKYKISKAVKVTKATAGVAVSTAGVVLPGTTALAVVVLARSMIALGSEIASIATHVEDKIQDLRDDLVLLQKEYEKKSGRKEIAGEALNAFFGVNVARTAANAKSDFEDIRKNVAQIWHRATKKGTKLEEAKKKCLELGLAMESVRTTSKASIAEMKQFDQLVANFDKLEKQHKKLVKRVTAADRCVPPLKRAIMDLDNMRNQDADKWAAIISTVISVTWDIAGLSDAGFIAKDMGSTLNACVGAADNIVSMSREIAAAR